MSTEVARPAGKVKLTVDEFRRIIDTGVFEDRRVQLLDGELFEVTKNPPHDFTVSVVADRLRTILPARRWVVREEKTIEPWPFWWPEPDITVARGPHRRYEHRHPGPRRHRPPGGGVRHEPVRGSGQEAPGLCQDRGAPVLGHRYQSAGGGSLHPSAPAGTAAAVPRAE